MRYERKIGKKVWKLEGSLTTGHFHLGSKKEYTLIEVKSGADCGDWANHFIIKDDESGETTEVREFQCIFIFKGNVEEYLSLNDCYVADVVTHPEGQVEVFIENGDWKHEHLWCEQLMGYIGYTQIDETVTEEDGSDNYSSIHTFKKIAK